MALDYMVSLDCQIKERHGDGLVRMIKSRAALEMLIDAMRASGDKRSLDEIEITRVITRPDGATEVKVTAAELRGDTVALDVEREYCAGCPANRESAGFGCFGSRDRADARADGVRVPRRDSVRGAGRRAHESDHRRARREQHAPAAHFVAMLAFTAAHELALAIDA